MPYGININILAQMKEYNGEKSTINREYSKLNIRKNITGTGDVGYIIPSFARELAPMDKIEIEQSIGIQFTPFVSQVFHEFQCVTHSFFVPYRLLDKEFEDFIKGGVDGTNTYEQPSLNLEKLKKDNNGTLIGTALDYLCYPVTQTVKFNEKGKSRKPCAYYLNAYNKIYNDIFRPIDVQQEEVPLDNIKLHKSLWSKDYFTASKRWQLRGIVPTIPVDNNLIHRVETTLSSQGSYSTSTPRNTDQWGSVDGVRYDGTPFQTEKTLVKGNSQSAIASNTVGLMSVEQKILDHDKAELGVSILDFIQTMGITAVLFQSNNIRYLYNDYLMSFWGAPNQDLLTGLAKHIDSKSFDVTSQGIVQTAYGDVSAGQTPQGHLTSQAQAMNENTTYYQATEWGVFLTVYEIKPATAYYQGLDMLMSVRNRFEMQNPLLVNMPRRAIENGEIFYTGEDTDRNTFAWTEIYDEYRTSYNTVVGLMRPDAEQSLASFTLVRNFEECPVYNLEFLQCNPDMQRILQYTEEPHFEFIINNNYSIQQAIPVQPDPETLMNLI